MISWFKKPKLEFQCRIAGVERIMPIIAAKDYKHPWVERARQELRTLKQDPNWGTKKSLHSSRCPGIFSLQRTGWIIRTWQDITIETNGDGESFTWTSAIDQKTIAPILGDYVSSHGRQQLYDFTEHWKPNTLKNVIKIVNPWMVKIPKGYYLMEMPIPYLDEDRFTTLPGFAHKDRGFTGLSTLMLWHVIKGKTVIKAGTPIVQLMLVKETDFDFSCTTIADPNEVQLYDLARSCRFITDYNEIKKLYKD